MDQIDLPLAAELVIALFLVATLDGPPATPALPEQPLDDPAPKGWTPENDSHARRILRLEHRRGGLREPLS